MLATVCGDRRGRFEALAGGTFMLFARQSGDDATVVAVLAAALRRDISFGTLLPDEKLKIEKLRQRYGGSNHSMRETLRQLSAEGLVEAVAQRGFRVTSATEEDRLDILLMRVQIERLGLARSMERANVSWEAGLVAAQHALGRADQQVAAAPDDLNALEWDEACRAFHAALVAGCGSPRLMGQQAQFYNQSRRFRLAQLREGQVDFAARGQRRNGLVSAVLDRDVDRALGALEHEITAEIAPDRG